MTTTDNQLLGEAIVKNGWYKTGEFVLSSGHKSDFYIDLRPAMLNNSHVSLLTAGLLREIRPMLHQTELLCGVVSSGLFLAGVMLQRLEAIAQVSAIYCRTEHRQHGQKKEIEGVYQPGQRVILLDDVATTGASLERVAKILSLAGFEVSHALVVVDREEGASQRMSKYNIPLVSVLKLSELKKFFTAEGCQMSERSEANPLDVIS